MMCYRKEGVVRVCNHWLCNLAMAPIGSEVIILKEHALNKRWM